MIEIRCEDCFDTMDYFKRSGIEVDIILTSPPYNSGYIDDKSRYDVFVDRKSTEDYVKWTVDLFNRYDGVLKKNGVVLYNINYGATAPTDMYLAVAEVIRQTNFMTADCICWYKTTATPNNSSMNKLTRWWECVFVFCRKDEYNTFHCNKKVDYILKSAQAVYKSIPNIIRAKNNDELQSLNKATFSSELCCKLLDIYAPEGGVVYDSFMGTGTTAVACKLRDLSCYGSEISRVQVEYTMDRLSKVFSFDIDRVVWGKEA